MNELTDRDRAAFAAVDDALRTRPRSPAPPGFSRAVAARIRTLTPAPRFRLAWIDYAISLFAAGMAGLVFLMWQSIPPLWLARAQVQSSLLLSGADPAFLVPAVASGLLLAAMALFVALVVFTRGRGHLPLID